MEASIWEILRCSRRRVATPFDQRLGSDDRPLLERRVPTEAAWSGIGRLCRDTCDEERAEPSDGIVVRVCCQFDRVGRLVDGSHRGIVRPTSARSSQRRGYSPTTPSWTVQIASWYGAARATVSVSPAGCVSPSAPAMYTYSRMESISLAAPKTKQGIFDLSPSQGVMRSLVVRLGFGAGSGWRMGRCPLVTE